MTIEQIELRKILSQMLADNGINRETIGDIVKEIVEDKTGKAIKQKVLHETNLESLIYSTIKQEVRSIVREEIRNKLRNYHFDFNVNVEIGEKR